MSENADIYRINSSDGKEIILVGTAHISKTSLELVRETIENEHPDTVCVELDEGRLKSIQDPDRWKKTDLKEVIKKKQLATLIANLVLGSYQKRMGDQTGVKPGSELKEAVNIANEKQIPLVLADRDIKITLKRTWACTAWYRKFSLLGGLFGSIFDKTEISEEDLAKIKEQDALNSMMQEFGKTFPEVKQVLIDERDQYLASKIRNAEGKKIVAVVGAGHVKGIAGIISENRELPSEESITVIPKGAPIWKIIGWAIPIAIVASNTGCAASRPVHGTHAAYRGRILYRAHAGLHEATARIRDGDPLRRHLAGEALVEEPRDPRDPLLPVSGNPRDYREDTRDIPDLPGVLEDEADGEAAADKAFLPEVHFPDFRIYLGKVIPEDYAQLDTGKIVRRTQSNTIVIIVH